MNAKQLYQRRGELLERIAGQRDALRRELAPIHAVLAKTESISARVCTYTERGVALLKEYPLTFGALLALLALKKTRFVFRWARRGLFARNLWKNAQKTVSFFWR